MLLKAVGTFLQGVALTAKSALTSPSKPAQPRKVPDGLDPSVQPTGDGQSAVATVPIPRDEALPRVSGEPPAQFDEVVWQRLLYYERENRVNHRGGEYRPVLRQLGDVTLVSEHHLAAAVGPSDPRAGATYAVIHAPTEGHVSVSLDEVSALAGQVTRVPRGPSAPIDPETGRPALVEMVIPSALFRSGLSEQEVERAVPLSDAREVVDGSPVAVLVHAYSNMTTAQPQSPTELAWGNRALAPDVFARGILKAGVRPDNTAQLILVSCHTGVVDTEGYSYAQATADVWGGPVRAPRGPVSVRAREPLLVFFSQADANWYVAISAARDAYSNQTVTKPAGIPDEVQAPRIFQPEVAWHTFLPRRR